MPSALAVISGRLIMQSVLTEKGTSTDMNFDILGLMIEWITMNINNQLRIRRR